MSAAAPTGRTPVAVVTIVRDRRAHLARQREWLRRHAADIPHVIVDMGGGPIWRSAQTTVVQLPVADGAALPLAAARNLGARAAHADVLVFLDVDCLPTAAVVPTYRDRVSSVGGVWSGPVGYLPPTAEIASWERDDLCSIARFHDGRPRPGQRPTAAPSPDLFWSLSFAVSAQDFESTGGFDESYTGYGGEDTDFARRVEAAGLDLWFDGDAVAFHQHHEVSSPPVEHLDDIVANAIRFRSTWGSWPMVGWLQEFADLGLVEWTPSGDHLRVLRASEDVGR